MAKGNQRIGRRRGDNGSDSDSDEGGNKHKAKSNMSNYKDLDFRQRRELQRKAAAEKRLFKMKCHLCGQAGHVRRECPGIDDDGRGESKFTKSNGDVGAVMLKTSNNTKSAKGAKNRGHKQNRTDSIAEELALPLGFSPNVKTEDDDDDNVTYVQGVLMPEPFRYYDAGCDCLATIEYLRSGRGKKKLSLKEATKEYQIAIAEAASSSNFGGCLSRSFIKRDRPFKDHTASPLLLNNSDNVWFLVGLDHDFLCNEESESNIDTYCLADTVASNDQIVGVFADLDYSQEAFSRSDCNRASQIRRLRCTCQAASTCNVPVQIRTTPAATAKGKDTAITNISYSEIMHDLFEVLLEITTLIPALRIHLSCWSGSAEDMNKILETFPDNVWVGMDGTMSFGKAKNAHECAFDVPLSKLLLETGLPQTIPADVARTLGREAFCHSGLVPYLAAALAGLRSSALEITAEDVARAASANTVALYQLE